jgi:hypothetical protein
MLYVDGGDGVVWNGLIKISEASTGGTGREFFLDGEKYLNLPSLEEYSATVEVVSFPKEFAPCAGMLKMYPGLYVDSQPRRTFGFSYRTLIGDELQGVSSDYKIHIVYNVLARVSENTHQTSAKSPGFKTYSWQSDAVPEPFIDYKPSSHFVIDTRKVTTEVLLGIEDILYGTELTDSRLPTVTELMNILVQGVTTGDVLMNKMVLAGTGKGKAKVTAGPTMKKMRLAVTVKGVAKVISGPKMKKMKLAATGLGVAKVISGPKMKKMKLAGLVESPFARTNSFEGGTNGTTLSTANSGGVSGNSFGNIARDTGHTLAFDSTRAMHGTLSLAIAMGATSGECYCGWAAGGKVPKTYGRFYIYQTAFVSANTRIAAFYQTSPNTNANMLVRLVSGGKLALVDAASGVLWTSAANMPLNQWIRVEFMCVGHATAGQAQISYYTGDSVTPIEASSTFTNQNTGGEIDAVAWGVSSAFSNLTKLWIDDVAVSHLAPLGPSS